MEVGAAHDGLAALFEGAVEDPLAVAVGLWREAFGDFEPDEVADVWLRDLLFDDLLCGRGVIAVLLEEGDGLERPALVAPIASGQHGAVVGAVVGSGS